MTPIKRNLLYIFRGTLLRLRITWNHGESLTLSVGYHVDKTDAKGKHKWDGSRCRQNTTHGKDKVPASTINRAIEILEDKVDKAFLEYEKQDLMPTKEQLKNKLSDKRTKQEVSFFPIYDEFVQEGTDLKFWSEGTIKKLKSRKNLLLSFNKTCNLTLEGIDENVLNEYVRFQTFNCISKVKTKETYTNTTIVKNVNMLKWFLKWAERKGHIVNQAYKDYKPSLKTPDKQVIFLEWDELMRVYKHDFSSRQTLDIVRDGFCLCCFTSLRYSDLANLKKSDIYDDYIIVTTVKTSDTIKIDLNKYSKSILDKYKDYEGETALPVISNQKMNDRLKDICKECNIKTPTHVTTFVGSKRQNVVKEKWELISTHCGRRTFISNALSLGISPNIVMKWTGHSDYQAMKPYIDIADNARKSSMMMFDNMDKESEKRKYHKCKVLKK